MRSNIRHPSPIYPLIATWAALVAAVYTETLGDDLILQFGAYSFRAPEVVLFLSLIGLFSLTRGKQLRVGLGNSAILLFALLLILSFFRGVVVDPGSALVTLRVTGVFTCFVLFAPFLGADDVTASRIVHALLATGLILVALAIARWFLGVGFLRLAPIVDFRPATSDSALLIGVAAILCGSRLMRHRASEGRLRDSLFLTVLLIGLVATDQRTAVIATLCGLALTAILEGGPYRQRRLIFMLFFGLAAILALGLAMIATGATSPADLLPSSLDESLAAGGQDLQWRYGIWDGFIRALDTVPLIDRLIGLPAGSHLFVVNAATGTQWEFRLHSMYLGLLPTAGWLGLVTYLGLLVAAATTYLRRAMSNSQSLGDLTTATSAGLLIACSIFGYSYELRAEQGLVLALGLVGVGRSTLVALRRRKLSASLAPSKSIARVA